MTGVPALVFAAKYVVMSAQPYPVLDQVVRQCEDKATASAANKEQRAKNKKFAL